MNRWTTKLAIWVGILLCSLAGLSSSPAEAQTQLIPLVSGGPQQGTFQSQYLSINYQYTVNRNQLTVSGKLNFDNSLTMNYPGLKHFYMEVLLVSGEGKVVERSNVTLNQGFTWGDDQSVAVSSFSAQLLVPPGTASMTFYYNGSTQGSVGGGTGIPFWYDPVSGAQ